MGNGFFSDLLRGIDCCENECKKIFCFKGNVKVKNPHNSCGCEKPMPCCQDKEYECECECECKKKRR